MIWVEIVGIGMENKGAELMLVAIKEQLADEFPQFRYVATPMSSYPDRARYGLYQKIWFDKNGLQLGRWAGNFIPQKIRTMFGLIKDEEISIILDASGFAYSSRWGVKPLKHRITNHIARWKRQDKLIIFLPQAFGPFDDRCFAAPVRILLHHADQLYARDPISRAELETYANGQEVAQAPDFTNLVKGRLPADHDPARHQICFIPNYRMVDKIDGNKRGYVDEMSLAIRTCLDNGRAPFLLLHEGPLDKQLAGEIIAQANAQGQVPLVRYDDPVLLKGVIGTSQIVVSSRFHGLVSALAQGVPVIATGWSHKYQALLDDYGCGDYLEKPEDGNISTRLSNLLGKEEYLDVKTRINKAAREQKQLSQNMWDNVKAAIREHISG